MKFIVILCLFVVMITSCKKDENMMHIVGHVEGLKKGKLYLEKMRDDALITIDSMTIDGDSHFSFSVPLKSPEIFYLYLDKKDANPANDRIMFFGEKGTTTITTTRDFFEIEAKIRGSAAQEKLEEYQRTIAKFHAINLDLIKAKFEAQKNNYQTKADSIQKLSDKNKVRSYLYTLNFALNNKNSYAAPYIALLGAPNAQLKYLDTIYKSLSPEVARSKYGKALKEVVEKTE